MENQPEDPQEDHGNAPDDAEIDAQGPVNRGDQRGIPRWRVHEVCRHLATEDITRAELARQFNVTRGAITRFADRHARRIDEIKANLDDEFAGIWLAHKSTRLAALQADYEQAAEHVNAGHHEWIRVRAAIAHQIAEEVGQLPARGVAVSGTVRHELVGVDLDDLT